MQCNAIRYLPNDNSYSHQSFVADWAFLAGRYAKTAVMGADLWNEPKDTVTWGGGNPATDWAAAATAAGNAILGSNPDWLVIVEGTGVDTWWGGNLMGVATNPIVLSVRKQYFLAIAIAITIAIVFISVNNIYFRDRFPTRCCTRSTSSPRSTTSSRGSRTRPTLPTSDLAGTASGDSSCRGRTLPPCWWERSAATWCSRVPEHGSTRS